MTDFISTDPALAAYYTTRNNDRAQQAGDIQLRDQQQTQGANDAIDAGLRQWFQGGQPAAAPAPAAAAPSPAQALPAPDPTQPDPSAAGAPATPAPAPAGATGPLQGIGVTAAPVAIQPAPAGPGTGSAAAPSAAATPAPSTGMSTAPSSALSAIGTDPYASAYGGIAKTPGTGRFLLQMSQQGQQQKQDATYRMFDAMDKGDVPQAQFLASQTGFQLPPGAWNDARTVRNFGQAKYFMPMYAGDEQQFGKFIGAAMRGAAQNGGTPDWNGALQAVPPRSPIAAKVEGATEAMGHAPSDESIEAMAGGRMPYAYGAPVPVKNDDGTTGYVQPNRLGGPARPVTGSNGQPVAAGARPVAPSVGVTTIDQGNGQGPQVVTYDKHGAGGQTLGAPKPGTGATQADKDFTAATSSVNNDPTFMGQPPAARDAEIQRRYDALSAGRQRNNTSARPAPAAAAARVDQGPATVHAGTQADPHQPQNANDFANIPSGQIYTDPGDGKLYRKP